MHAVGEAVMAGLREALARHGVPGHVTGHPTVFEVWFQDDAPTDHRSSRAADMLRRFRFSDLLLRHGVLKAAEKFFVSAAHSDDDVARTLEAFDLALGAL